MSTSNVVDQARNYWRKRYGRQVASRIAKLDTQAVSIISDESQNMIQMHLAFLDYLTRESAYACDYRVEFLTFYIQHRPDKTGMLQKKGAHQK
jgi:hypothetical protein